MSFELPLASYLILGIGTDVGKTFLAENLCQKIANSCAIKPIITGFDADNLQSSDSAKLLLAMGHKISMQAITEISPWHYSLPVAPCFAGNVDFSQLISFCKTHIQLACATQHHLFIESAGGVMTPITWERSFVDLASLLQIPVLLVGANYLGAISHLLTAIVALEAKNVKISKILINQHQGSAVAPATLKTLLHLKTGIEILTFDEFLLVP